MEEIEMYSKVKFYLEYSFNFDQIRNISLELLDGNTYEDVYHSWEKSISEFYLQHPLNKK